MKIFKLVHNERPIELLHYDGSVLFDNYERYEHSAINEIAGHASIKSLGISFETIDGLKLLRSKGIVSQPQAVVLALDGYNFVFKKNDIPYMTSAIQVYDNEKQCTFLLDALDSILNNESVASKDVIYIGTDHSISWILGRKKDRSVDKRRLVNMKYAKFLFE